MRALREVLETSDLRASFFDVGSLSDPARAFQLFNQRRQEVFSHAWCAASCSRSHSFVRARREVLETKDLPPSLLT